MELSRFFEGHDTKTVEVVNPTGIPNYSAHKTVHWTTFEKCDMVAGAKDPCVAGVVHHLTYEVRVKVVTAETAKEAGVLKEYNQLLKILGVA